MKRSWQQSVSGSEVDPSESDESVNGVGEDDDDEDNGGDLPFSGHHNPNEVVKENEDDSHEVIGR